MPALHTSRAWHDLYTPCLPYHPKSLDLGFPTWQEHRYPYDMDRRAEHTARDQKNKRLDNQPQESHRADCRYRGL